MRTVVARIQLGRTRIAGYTIYNSESLAFDELTPREVKYLIKDKQINGLKMTKDGEIILDLEGFNQHNLMIKSGVGNYWPMNPAEGLAQHEMFSLTKVADTDQGMVYEVVSTRCARLPITEAKLRSLYDVNCLVGCWINDKTGMIRLADGVEMVDMTSEAIMQAMEKQMQQKKQSEPEAATTEVIAPVEESIPVAESNGDSLGLIEQGVKTNNTEVKVNTDGNKVGHEEVIQAVTEEPSEEANPVIMELEAQEDNQEPVVEESTVDFDQVAHEIVEEALRIADTQVKEGGSTSNEEEAKVEQVTEEHKKFGSIKSNKRKKR